ncbi:MAG: TolC family protein [Chitinophagales bacterium]|nr:TolC family protein [Chitinophagales bacterium]HNL05976.1 TolC family protein [Chitinophagales bacterium]
MIKAYFSFWIGCMLLVIQPLYAQNPPVAGQLWSLQNCIDFATQNNLSRKQLSLNVKSAEINRKQSHDDRLPNVNGSLSYGVNFGRSIDPTTNTFETQVSQASQIGLNSAFTLYNGNRINLTQEQRQLQLELAKLQIDEYDYNLQLSVLGAYLQILLSQAQLEVLLNQAAMTQEQYDQMQKMVDVGNVPAGNLLDIEAQMANDRLNEVNAQNAVNAAYLALQQTLNYYEPFQIVPPTQPMPALDAIDKMTAQEIYETASGLQPTNKVNDMQIQIAEKQLQIARTNLKPIVTLNASMNTRYSSLAKNYEVTGVDPTPVLAPYITENFDSIYTFNPVIKKSNIPIYEQWGDNFGGYVGVGMQVPIFNQYQVRNSMALAQIGIENARLTQQNNQNQLRQQIEQAYLNAKAAAERYKATQSNIAALEKNFNFIKKRYELGMANNLDFNNAKNNLIGAQLNLQAAQFEYIFRLKILDYYSGKSLEL